MRQNETIDPRLIDKAKELIALKKDYDSKRLVAEEAKRKTKEKEFELISLMESFGLNETGSKFGHPDIGTIARRERFFGKITDMELASKLFEEAGIYDQVLKLTPVKKRLNEFINELIQGSKPMPGLDFYVEPYISVLKA